MATTTRWEDLDEASRERLDASYLEELSRCAEPGLTEDGVRAYLEYRHERPDAQITTYEEGQIRHLLHEYQDPSLRPDPVEQEEHDDVFERFGARRLHMTNMGTYVIIFLAHVFVVMAAFVAYLIVTGGFVYALSQLDVDLLPILGALGVIGIALAFAFQNILENFIAGVLILIRRPIRIGEQVSLSETEGTVADINLRAVIVKQVDGKLVYVPNASVLNNPIVNFTREGARRTTLAVGVAHERGMLRAGDDADPLRQLVGEVPPRLHGVLQEAAEGRQAHGTDREAALGGVPGGARGPPAHDPPDVRRQRAAGGDAPRVDALAQALGRAPAVLGPQGAPEIAPAPRKGPPAGRRTTRGEVERVAVHRQHGVEIVVLAAEGRDAGLRPAVFVEDHVPGPGGEHAAEPDLQAGGREHGRAVLAAR